ncbi:SulP family inorganic anion transporter [Marivita sp.]|uniref:SulP family inorganic anion transporter n=1 Tax=Marivita sp. TaxID=2003365 RepID=UPI00262F635E|nr:SulP family inorganic anion transporter [Marivita sp.]
MLLLVRSLFGAVFTALVSAVFAISFAAIIYQGALAPYLDRGIGLVLLGAVVIAFTGAFTLSYKGTILAPQDVPAILLAGAAATIVAQGELDGEALFATVACLAALSSVMTGLVGVLVGHLRFAYLARFVPYPVLAGFLAATGLLLVIGGLNVALGDAPEAATWTGYLAPDLALKWMPAMVAALAILLLTRMAQTTMALPIALTLTAVGFYAMLWVLGLSLDEARSIGLLLGPFTEGNLLDGLGPQLLVQADWGMILAQAPVIVTIIATCMLGATLNASGMELALKRDFDISTEVKGAGIANILSGFAGAIPGYHIVAETILANRLGLVGRLAGISSGLGCLAVLLLGANTVSGLPVGLFAAVLIFLGIDLLYTWVWEERRRLGRVDYSIVLLIPVIAIAFGFLTAIAVGLLVACGLFIVSYAKLDLIRSESDLRVRRSPVERPDTELRLLANFGGAVKIAELSGFLFFGSANALREKMRTVIASKDPQTECLVLDFGHASGVDISTIRVLSRIASDCADHEVKLVLSGLPPQTLSGMQSVLIGQEVDFVDTLSEALEHIEDIVITHHQKTETTSAAEPSPQIDAFGAEMPIDGVLDRIDLATGDVLVKLGATSDEIYYLQSGELKILVPDSDGEVAVVAKVRPRAVIGEMAYYSGKVRSADIVASAPSVVLRINMARIDQLEQTNPAAALAFHKAIAGGLARRLSRTTQLLRDLGA